MRATSCGGGRRPATREDGWDTGGRWDGVDGARRWRLGGGRRQRNGGGETAREGARVGEKSSTATTRSG
jgi:hypothetical protein